MRQSTLFTKTIKETPKDEVSKNAQLLLRGGFIYKEMAGAYDLLPLGLRVLNKIISVIREEMDSVGGQEITLTSLQNQDTWTPTNQWDDTEVDVWFKTKLKNDTMLGLAFTHEAAITKMMSSFVHSYRDLPKLVYQFQTKFRNEVRAKSGIIRTREFIMKDMYSFARTQVEHDELYEKIKMTYIKIFNRLGLGDDTYVTIASGGVFSKFSHEFQVASSAGEDNILVSKDKRVAINKEVCTDELLAELNLSKAELIEKKSIEVGNIFNLGTRFSSALNLQYRDEEGNNNDVIMGSYGIGPGRVMGTLVEVFSDDKGIIWPEVIAPFKVHLIILGNNEEIKSQAEGLYQNLMNNNIDVLLDDRQEVSNGQKLSDADLIGCPWRIIISEKSLAEGGAEIKKRNSKDSKIIDLQKIIESIS
jgi:prolyl-tRNA synthetase